MLDEMWVGLAPENLHFTGNHRVSDRKTVMESSDQLANR